PCARVQGGTVPANPPIMPSPTAAPQTGTRPATPVPPLPSVAAAAAASAAAVAEATVPPVPAASSRTMGLAIAAIAAVAVIGAGGYFGYRVFAGDGAGQSTAATQPSKSIVASPAPAPAAEVPKDAAAT